MYPSISGYFKNKKDAEDAISELKVLGVDKLETREENGSTIVIAEFSEVTGIRNVFEKRNAYEIREIMPNRE